MKIFYICDKKACGDICPNKDCEYTAQIKHAKNFKSTKLFNGREKAYWEENNGREEGM